MKILILAGQFFPKIVGSGTATFFIARDLANRGHEVTVAMDDEDKDLLDNSSLSFKSFSIPLYKEFATGKYGFREITIDMYKLLKSCNFDIVHIFSYMPMLAFSFIRDIFELPVIFTFWNTPYKTKRAVGFYENSDLDTQLGRNIIKLKKYNRLILGSRCSYESALSLGADPEITSFVYHGIDLKEFRVDLAKSSEVDLELYFGDQLKKDELLITLPGRIVPRKGITEAVEAFLKINRVYPKSKLLLTGMIDPYDKKLAKKIMVVLQKTGLKDKVLIPKVFIPRKHLPAVYKRSNIVITPSYYEGLGFTAIEALVAERPLVATDVPGLNEVCKDEKNCLLIPPRDSQALSDSIMRLLEDTKLSKKLASYGPKSVEKFNMKHFVDYVEKTYVNLLNKK